MPKKATKKTKKQKAPKSKQAAAKPAQVSEPSAAKLPNVIELARETANILWLNRRLFLWITLIYAALSLVLVQGLASSSSVASIKSQLDKLFSGHLGSLGSSFSIFALLVGSPGNSSNPSGGAYQLFLGLIVSLAVIWSLRQVMSGNKVLARDAYYKGMTPLIPFIIVLIVIGLQLIPLLIGTTIYATVVSGGIAAGVIEKALFLLLLVALAALSLYLITSSLMALYIVTLKDMTPIRSLRSAKDLVKKRRWLVLRKMLFLPVALIVLSSVIMAPIILISTVLAQWIFFLLTMFTLVVIHGYMYNLYRGLLNEA